MAISQRGVWLRIEEPYNRLNSERRYRSLEVAAGDVIFTTSSVNYYHDDPALGVGHVGIATGERTGAYRK